VYSVGGTNEGYPLARRNVTVLPRGSAIIRKISALFVSSGERIVLLQVYHHGTAYPQSSKREDCRSDVIVM
jgi:hypothetical protein